MLDQSKPGAEQGSDHLARQQALGSCEEEGKWPGSRPPSTACARTAAA